MNILHPVESLRNRRHQLRLESHLEQGGFLQQPTHHFSQADCYVQGDKLLVNFPKSRNILEVSGFGEKPIFKAKKHRDEASLNKGVPQTQVQITRPSGESISLGNVVRERESDELASKALRVTLEDTSLVFRSVEKICEIDLNRGTITQAEPEGRLRVDSEGHIEPPKLFGTTSAYDEQTARLVTIERGGPSYYFSDLPLDLVCGKMAKNSALPKIKDNQHVHPRDFRPIPFFEPDFDAGCGSSLGGGTGWALGCD